MLKRVVSYILVTVFSLMLFAGCSPASDRTNVFNAEKFVDECRILVLSTQYDESNLKDFEIDFIKAVLIQFGKSDFYKNMTDGERETAFNEIGEVLLRYSYGQVKNGFTDKYSVDMNTHKVTCRLKDFQDSEVMWSMPGY